MKTNFRLNILSSYLQTNKKSWSSNLLEPLNMLEPVEPNIEPLEQIYQSHLIMISDQLKEIHLITDGVYLLQGRIQLLKEMSLFSCTREGCERSKFSAFQCFTQSAILHIFKEFPILSNREQTTITLLVSWVFLT